MSRLASILAMILALALGPRLVAQGTPEPIRWSLASDAASVKSDQLFHALLTAEIDNGWHLYALQPMENGPSATQIDVPSGQAFQQAGAVLAGEPEMDFDPNFQMDVQFYEGEALFKIPVIPVGGTPAGKQSLIVSAMFQTCNDHMCLPPTRVKLTTAVILLAGVAGPTLPRAAGAGDTPKNKSPTAKPNPAPANYAMAAKSKPSPSPLVGAGSAAKAKSLGQSRLRVRLAATAQR